MTKQNTEIQNRPFREFLFQVSHPVSSKTKNFLNEWATLEADLTQFTNSQNKVEWNEKTQKCQKLFENVSRVKREDWNKTKIILRSDLSKARHSETDEITPKVARVNREISLYAIKLGKVI